MVVYAMIFYGSVVELWGGQQHADVQALCHRVFVPDRGGRHSLVRGCLGQFLDDAQDRRDCRPRWTAIVGLITAYLLTRQTFAGKNAFEFGTMLSFAIPGTVIGVSYILAFNVPPIEITGTGIILVVSFIFRQHAGRVCARGSPACRNWINRWTKAA